MKRLMKTLVTCFFFAQLCPWILWAAVYQIDPVHSNIGFAVKHLMVSTTRGKFADYNGQIEFDPKSASVFKAEVTIQANSIDTDNADRDNHLKSADFLDTANHPAINFRSKKLIEKDGGYEILGDLSIHGITKEIAMPVTISGPIQSPSGKEVIGISGETTINRQDFGVSWNKVMDKGGLMVDNNVRIIVDIEAGKE